MLKSCLMVQGTSSDAGKSTLVAGLCRVLARAGAHVAPFKPQNMALNSAVTHDGGEIGRAQALQAQACNIDPHTDMNPVLIKPSSDIGAQIIIQGQALQDMDAKSFHAYKPLALKAVLESFSRLSGQYDYVVVEGAGSPAEINLRDGDIANMGFAEAVDCPVILVADIDRGGVFAQLVGTLELLAPSEQDRVIGFVINKFRGDIALLESGLDWLEARCGKPVFGVLPYLHDLYIDSEDAIDTRQNIASEAELQNILNVVVPVLPRISNHTDFDALRLHPNVRLTFVSCQQTPPPADLVILPGSKNVRADLKTLRENKWDSYLQRHLRFGGKLIGICGGYQMLGKEVSDHLGIEGPAGNSKGFGFIPMSTEFHSQKILSKKTGTLYLDGTETEIIGYEIHHGRSQFLSPSDAVLKFSDASTDGFVDPDNQIFGCYLHGVMDEPKALSAILKWAGLDKPKTQDLNALRERELNRLADSLEQNLNLESLFSKAFDYIYRRSPQALTTASQSKVQDL